MITAPERILIAGPSITGREVELVAEATRTAWFANHQAYNTRFEQPAFAGRSVGKRFVTANNAGHEIARRGINLPSGYHMRKAKVSLVSGALREILEQQRRQLVK